MKKGTRCLAVLLVVLSIAFIFSACSSSLKMNPLTGEIEEKSFWTGAKTTIFSGGIPEVLPGVFDTGNGTAYIKFDYSQYVKDDILPEADIVAGDLMLKKERWKEMFPEKRIIAMATMMDHVSKPYITFYFTSGILIHYE